MYEIKRYGKSKGHLKVTKWSHSTAVYSILYECIQNKCG